MCNNKIKLSSILQETLDKFENCDITISQLSNELGTRAYGTFLVLMSLPNFIPLLSVVSCILLIFHSAQMSFGITNPWMPKILKDYSFKKQSLEIILSKNIHLLEASEHFIKPRLLFMNSIAGLRITGVIIFFINLILLVPIPFSNFIPATAIMMIGLGLIQKDGLMVLISAFLGVSYCIVFIILLVSAIDKLF